MSSIDSSQSLNKESLERPSASNLETKLSQSTAWQTNLHKILEAIPNEGEIDGEIKFEAKAIEELWDNIEPSLKSGLQASLISNKIFFGSMLTGKELKILIANPKAAKQLQIELRKELVRQRQLNDISVKEIKNLNSKEDGKFNDKAGLLANTLNECKKNIESIKSDVKTFTIQYNSFSGRLAQEEKKDPRNEKVLADLEVKKTKFRSLLQKKEALLKEAEEKLNEVQRQCEQEGSEPTSLENSNTKNELPMNTNLNPGNILEGSTGNTMINEAEVNKNEEVNIEKATHLFNNVDTVLEKAKTNRQEGQNYLMSKKNINYSREDLSREQTAIDKCAESVIADQNNLKSLKADVESIVPELNRQRMNLKAKLAEIINKLMEAQGKHQQTAVLEQSASQKKEKSGAIRNNLDKNLKIAIAKGDSPSKLEVIRKELLAAEATENSDLRDWVSAKEKNGRAELEAQILAEDARRVEQHVQACTNKIAEAERLLVEIEHEIIENRILLLDLQQYSAQIKLAIAQKELADTLAGVRHPGKIPSGDGVAKGKSENIRDESRSHESAVQASRKEIALVEASLNAIAAERRKLQHKLEELEKALDVDINKGDEVARILDDNIKSARILGQSGTKA